MSKKCDLTEEEFLIFYRRKRGRRSKHDYQRAVRAFDSVTKEYDKIIPIDGAFRYKPRKIKFEGITMEMYGPKVIAVLCLVDPIKVYNWCFSGLMPQSVIPMKPHKHPIGGMAVPKLYTAFEVLGYAQAYREAYMSNSYFTAKLVKEPFRRVNELALRFARENPQALNLVLNWKEYNAEYENFRRRLWLYKMGIMSRKIGDMKKMLYKMDEWTE